MKHFDAGDIVLGALLLIIAGLLLTFALTIGDKVKREKATTVSILKQCDEMHPTDHRQQQACFEVMYMKQRYVK